MESGGGSGGGGGDLGSEEGEGGLGKDGVRGGRWIVRCKEKIE